MHYEGSVEEYLAETLVDSIRAQIESAELFACMHADSVWFEIENLGVLIPTKINKKVLQDVEPIPSIIGNDFLEDQKLTLVFNPSQKITFLELP
jgi:hypothetical protein